MRRFFIVFVMFSCMTGSKAQSLGDSIRWYFNYDTLHHVGCSQTPAGIYALTFRVDRKGNAYDIGFSTDSVPVLKNLLVSALRTCVGKIKNYKTGKKYLQLVYYNYLYSCIYDLDSSANVEHINKQAAEFYSRQVRLIEKSLRNAIQDEGEFIILKPAIMNDENPHIKRDRIKA
ncbi:MAG: hypothetical protein Q8941_22145 [Bacteroidota bacterium]|nr:hypothetical protein [Bacteroidota bacterium]